MPRHRVEGVCRLLAAAAVAALTGACSESAELPIGPSSPEGPGVQASFLPQLQTPTPVQTEYWLCKVGNLATFHVTARWNPGPMSGPTLDTHVTLLPNTCQLVHTNGEMQSHRVEVEETPADNFQMTRARQIENGVLGPLTTSTSNPISRNLDDERGHVVTFFDYSGCEVGYWKQSSNYSRWPAGLSPTDLFADAFEPDAFPGLTFAQVLEQGGGQLNALGRQAAAALLNATHTDVNYRWLEQAIRDEFNALNPDGSNGAINALARTLEGFNASGCPFTLQAPPPPTGGAPQNAVATDATGNGKSKKADVTWQGGESLVDVYRMTSDGSPGSETFSGMTNSATFQDNLGKNAAGHYSWKVCNAGQSGDADCAVSNELAF